MYILYVHNVNFIYLFLFSRYVFIGNVSKSFPEQKIMILNFFLFSMSEMPQKSGINGKFYLLFGFIPLSCRREIYFQLLALI